MSTIKIPRKRILSTLDRRGWVQGKWGDLSPDGDGPVCLHGAVRICQQVPGDAYLIQQVWEHLGHGPGWNDADDTRETEVRQWVRSAPSISDADLADTFGPQWQAIVALVRRATVITAAEAGQIQMEVARVAAWDAAGAAARVAARVAAGAAAWDAAWAAARVAARVAAWDAAWAAAGALTVRDLIGQHGFEQHHYDKLTHPWASVIGPVHPDD